MSQENFPDVKRLRIIYTPSKINNIEDPVYQTVLNTTAKLYGGAYFTCPDGSTGTAFFVAMPADWEPPAPGEIQSNDPAFSMTSEADSSP